MTVTDPRFGWTAEEDCLVWHDEKPASKAATLSKDDVNYRDAESPARSCATCVMFRPSQSASAIRLTGVCTLVKGQIFGDDVCDRWYGKKDKSEAWEHELRGPHGEWVTTLTGNQQFYHVTRRPGPITHLPPSAAGESGPGVYLAGDKPYADRMAAWDKTMRVLPVTVHAGSGLHLLDRTKPGGEEEYRRIMQMENGNKQKDLDKVLAAHGYGGVRNLSPGNEYPETVIHDPGRLTVLDTVSKKNKVSFTDLVKVGKKGYIHGWIYVGPSAPGTVVTHPSHGPGKVTGTAEGTATIKFKDGIYDVKHRPSGEPPRMKLDVPEQKPAVPAKPAVTPDPRRPLSETEKHIPAGVDDRGFPHSIDLSGMEGVDPELQREVSRRVQAFASSFPEAAKTLTSVKAGVLEDHVYASTHYDAEGNSSITLNTTFYGDRDAYSLGLIKARQQHFHPLSQTQYVIDHELGHVLSNSRYDGSRRSMPESDSVFSNFSRTTSRLGGYAHTHPAEAFAEAFAVWQAAHTGALSKSTMDMLLEPRASDLIDNLQIADQAGDHSSHVYKQAADPETPVSPTCEGFVPDDVLQWLKKQKRKKLKKARRPDLVKVGPEGYIHGYICVRPPCGPAYKKPVLDSKHGTVQHDDGTKIGQIHFNSADKTYRIQHKPTKAWLDGFKTREDAAQAVAIYHNIHMLHQEATKPGEHMTQDEADVVMKLLDAKKAFAAGEMSNVQLHLAQARSAAGRVGNQLLATHLDDTRAAFETDVLGWKAPGRPVPKEPEAPPAPAPVPKTPQAPAAGKPWLEAGFVQESRLRTSIGTGAGTPGDPSVSEVTTYNGVKIGTVARETVLSAPDQYGDRKLKVTYTVTHADGKRVYRGGSTGYIKKLTDYHNQLVLKSQKKPEWLSAGLVEAVDLKTDPVHPDTIRTGDGTVIGTTRTETTSEKTPSGAVRFHNTYIITYADGTEIYRGSGGGGASNYERLAAYHNQQVRAAGPPEPPVPAKLDFIPSWARAAADANFSIEEELTHDYSRQALTYETAHATNHQGRFIPNLVSRVKVSITPSVSRKRGGGESTTLGLHYQSQRRIELSPRVFAEVRPDSAKKSQDWDNNAGWWSGADPQFSLTDQVTAHEFGHGVDWQITSAMSQEKQRQLWNALAQALDVVPITTRLSEDNKDQWVKKNKAAITKAVSKYGSKNSAEMQAELWSEYTMKANPRPAAKAYGDFVMRYLPERVTDPAHAADEAARQRAVLLSRLPDEVKNFDPGSQAVGSSITFKNPPVEVRRLKEDLWDITLFNNRGYFQGAWGRKSAVEVKQLLEDEWIRRQAKS